MTVPGSAAAPSRFAVSTWIFPALVLSMAYGLLGLTFVSNNGDHLALMSRCVLMDANRSRIWSVSHVEIGTAYLGIFAAMVFYFLRLYGRNRAHLTDLFLAIAYIIASFTLDALCVANFQPFVALLIGDAIVITFTVIVSRQLWFQRLLGVFVPLVFLTCGVGHLLEGLSFWQMTYRANTPWTMVTADIGFAILINAVRFPAFIRGQDILDEMEVAKAEEAARQTFFRDVLLSVTAGRLWLCASAIDLPTPLPDDSEAMPVTQETLRAVRVRAKEAALSRHFPPEQVDNLQTAVAEAALNAVVHGGGGESIVRADDDAVQVWISDRGQGIKLSQMPRVMLDHAFETKDDNKRGFAGQGFWLMLRTADRLDLYTSTQGTTLVLTVTRRSVSEEMPSTVRAAAFPA